MGNTHCHLQHTRYLSKINFALGKQGLHFAFFYPPPCLLYVSRYWLVPVDTHISFHQDEKHTQIHHPTPNRCDIWKHCGFQCLFVLAFLFYFHQNNTFATSLHLSVFTCHIYVKQMGNLNRIQLLRGTEITRPFPLDII